MTRAPNRDQRISRIVRRWCLLALLGTLGCEDMCGVGPELDDLDIYAEAGEALPGTSDDDLEIFERGREVMEREFLVAEGLGPRFNAVSCASCHQRPVAGGSGPRYRNFYIAARELQSGEVRPVMRSFVVTIYGPEPDATTTIPYVANQIAQRNAPPMFGNGLMERIPDEEILSREDPDDANGDGISGRANFENGRVGRFGFKSQASSTESFNRGAFFNQMGITSDPIPGGIEEQVAALSHRFMHSIVPMAHAQVGAPDRPTTDDDPVPDPEISTEDLVALNTFNQLLAVPAPLPARPEDERGGALFEEIGCAKCHVPDIALEDGMIHPYSDFLVHDMGPELDDGFRMGAGEPEVRAQGFEWRSAPLWGLRLTAPYLHDGRADTIDEAIRLHGGEGEASRDAYEGLSDEDRAALMSFLEAL